MSQAANVAGSTSAPTPVQVRFFHANGHNNVRGDLDALLTSGTRCIRGAVCYFTYPGSLFLRRHAAALAQPDSFFVASIDPPTNLDALLNLHEQAPGHVYIHLGGKTPEEIKVGRALMHSKILLAMAGDGCRLWVGSHNLTGQAIEGGNLEAAMELVAPEIAQPIQDAISHLEICRTTAELFDPSQMSRYREIQRERQPRPAWIIPQKLLVIHAETTSPPTAAPFTVHLRVVPTDFDQMFIMDREVRLYIHPLGGLKAGIPADFARSSLWKGSLTGVVRTEHHPHNAGLRGQFDHADFELDFPDVFTVPTLVPAGSSRVTPSSQVVLRIHTSGRPGEEVYSLEDRPVENLLVTDGNEELGEVDEETARFFTKESVSAAGRLVYRRVYGVRQLIRIAGYEETMRTDSPDRGESDQLDVPMLGYTAKEKERPVDAFFFVTKYLIDRSRQ